MTRGAPIRFHDFGGGRLLFTSEDGTAFTSSFTFLERLAHDRLTPLDNEFLQSLGIGAPEDRLTEISQIRGLADRFANSEPLSYFILVPTLRCDLRCGYCQVSRVNADQDGFDWSEATLEDTMRLIDGAPTGPVQIEFQGGEPLLRTDIISTVVERVSEARPRSRFVICTNLSEISEKAWQLIERQDVFVSTSLDGPKLTHQQNRTATNDRTDQFFRNLSEVIETCGSDRVSALPTIDYRNPPDPNSIIECYSNFGLSSIYLRPVNYQGFARKSHRDKRSDAWNWNKYYKRFIDELINFNAKRDNPIEEFYLSICLKRCLAGGTNQHVDLRNPNMYGIDYIVVDYDGLIYPTDEARMLSRSRVIDLSVGHVASGFERDHPTLAALNSECANNFDPDCIHCAFQPACGVDLIDDISRYGRRDLPRSDTFFCQRQTHIFDLSWTLLIDQSPEVRHSVCAWLNIPYTDQPLVPHHD